MSAHYSKFELNTYRGTPYFREQVPDDYPLDFVLMKSRAFLRLPPTLQKLSRLAKRWADRVDPQISIQDWYDEEGHELDPNTQQPLTDGEIAASWEGQGGPPEGFEVIDIEEPSGGFPDPDTWQETVEPEGKTHALNNLKTNKQLLRDIASRGREVVAREYGIPIEQLPTSGESKTMAIDDQTAHAGKICVATDWGVLHSVMVGRCENDVFAPVPWQPSVPGLPKEGKVRYADFAPEEWEKAKGQLDNLVAILEGEGVTVCRPPLVPIEEAMSSPVGLVQMYAREAFTVIGDTLIFGQCRTPFRRKESRAVEPLFAGHCPVLRLPSVPDDIADSLPDDPLPYIEGGDVYRLGKDAIITMSGLASSPVGFRFIADALECKGITVWPAYLSEKYEHGDYVLMLVREGLCVACKKGFVDGMLPSPITDWDCVEITEEEADPGMAGNGIVVRENLIIMQQGSPRVVRALKKKGVDVIEVEFDGVAFFGGSVDCSTNDLWREGDVPKPPDLNQTPALLSVQDVYAPPNQTLLDLHREIAERVRKKLHGSH